MASYFNVQVNGLSNPNAAWTYRDPSQAAEKIKDYVGFWHGVQVTPAVEQESPRTED
jgi:uncharacterized protein (DUF427 family)